MIRLLSATLAVGFLALAAPSLQADEQDVKTTIDKAIKALGGEEKLGKVDAYSWKSKGKITFNDNESDVTLQGIMQGLDHYRGQFEGDFGGNKIEGVTIVNGDKGWRKFNDNLMEMDADALANEKRNVYMNVVTVTILPLKKGKGFKVESAGEEKVGDRPAVVLKVTGPDGKDFRLFLDKESGLPVKSEATVAGFDGMDVLQESIYRDYKDFQGIKKATKTEIKRDGKKFLDQEITEFKVEDKVDPAQFAEPK
jgi:hypothetical protein